MSKEKQQSVRSTGLTRREAIVRATVTVGGLALGSKVSWAAAPDEISRTAEAIHQEPVFNASRQRVYDALTRTELFNKVVQLGAAVQSGMRLGSAPTQISDVAGGAFALFGGHIIGRHVELVANERIVQAWRVVDWNPGVYSIAKFELAEQGAGTKIVFDHTGFPSGQAEHLAEGWKTNYWEPLAKFLG